MDENLLKLKAAAEARLAKKEAAQGAGGGGDAPWVTDNVLGAMMARGLAAFAAISLVSGYPTVASLPHSIGNAYMVLIAIAVECDEISLERANPYRARLAEAPK